MKTAALISMVLFLAACGAEPGGEPPPMDSGTEVAPPPPTMGLFELTWTMVSPDPSLTVGAGGCYKLTDWTAHVDHADWCSAIHGFALADDACAVASCAPGEHGATVVLACGRCSATYDVAFSP